MARQREIILVRHGYSGNRGESYEQYGPEGAPLREHGWQEAEAVGRLLIKWGFNPTKEMVAVSPKLRTRQTAKGAGCQLQRMYTLLDEVNPQVGVEEYEQIVQSRSVPERARNMVATILGSPSEERVWFMHGVPMGWLLEVCGYGELGRLIPPSGAVRKVRI
jgi:phosphohistidine phosphatase SixA